MIDIREVRDAATGEITLEIPLSGRQLLDCSLLNKGSAFPEAERQQFQLTGLLPARVTTLDEQAAIRYRDFKAQKTPLDQFLFLRGVQDRNETLFFRLLFDHIQETMPVVYTPEVGEVCQRYSHIYNRSRGLFIAYPDRDKMDAILAHRPFRQVDVIVVTDSERILGLGDQGVGGIGIPVGKLALYTLCGGVAPGRTLPIVLDVGTNNAERLNDGHYLGWRHERIRGAEYDAFIEQFVQAVEKAMPGVLLQWEDFAQSNARRLLDRYRNRLCTFNDDIQGTGAVTLGALFAAIRAIGSRITDAQFVILGAGSAGTGIAELIVAALGKAGVSTADARSRLWLLSSQGLLHSGMKTLSADQVHYFQPEERVAGWRREPDGKIGLPTVVERVKPAALIGVCGQTGAFTEQVVRTMATHVARPIIFPLSNPTSQSEAIPADIIRWTEGRALIATGSPFAPVSFQGRTIPISQCNNAYVFPGLGLGLIASRARRVTDEMFLIAAEELGACAPSPIGPNPPLLPPLEQIHSVSRRIALAVGALAQRQELAPPMPAEEWRRTIDACFWQPRYVPLRYRAGE